MYKIQRRKNQPQAGISRISNGDILRQLAFDNSLTANIIFTLGKGQIILANNAACKLLGYSKKELMTKLRSAIFDTTETSYKKMLKERGGNGQSRALVTAIKKSSRRLSCEMTSVIFRDGNNLQREVTTLVDRSLDILAQKKIDIRKEKIVTDNIGSAISKQKVIDTRNNKIVADNIGIAISKQKDIDIKNNKTVADNIDIAISKQKDIDTRNNKIVADNIGIAISKQKAIDTRNNKIVADNIDIAISKQKDIDTRNNKIVADNIHLAITKQIQIDIKNKKIVDDNINLAISKQKDIDTKNNKTVADNINLAISKQKDIDTRNNKTVADNINLAISKQKDIDTKNEKIVADNIILALVKSDARLAANNDEHIKKFNLAAKLSYDGLWEWDLLTNEFLLGEGFEELFGYSSENVAGYIANWGNYLHPNDRAVVKKGLRDAIASTASKWQHAFRFVRAGGAVVNVFGRASIARQADGKAYRLIGVIHDLSRQKDLEEKLELQIATNIRQSAEYRENYKLVFNSSSDVLYDFDLRTNHVVVSDGFEKEFGYPTMPNMSPTELWANHIHPEDRQALTEDYARMIASTDMEWKYSCRFLKADNSIANILGSSIVLRNAAGKVYRLIGSMQDISKQTVLEEKLEKEILLKEKQISDATEDAKDTERSDIGKELHDNINQLLGASRLYLDMAKHGGPNSEMYLGRSSEYTVKAIEAIRQLSKGLTTDIIKELGLCEAIDNVSRDTMEISPVKISCDLEDVIEKSVSNKFKLNIFRIVQEQLNNILKYAGATKVEINLSLTKKSVVLTISDDGVGFDTVKKQKGIGITNIKSRAASYYGTADFVSEPGRGCVLTVTFPVTDALLNKT